MPLQALTHQIFSVEECQKQKQSFHPAYPLAAQHTCLSSQIHNPKCPHGHNPNTTSNSLVGDNPVTHNFSIQVLWIWPASVWILFSCDRTTLRLSTVGPYLCPAVPKSLSLPLATLPFCYLCLSYQASWVTEIQGIWQSEIILRPKEN